MKCAGMTGQKHEIFLVICYILTKDYLIGSKYFAPIIFFVKAIIFRGEVHKIEIFSWYSSISKYSINTRILRVSTSLLHAIAATKICTIPISFLVATSGTTTICALATTLDKLHQALLAMVSVVQTGTHVLHACALIKHC